MPHQKSMCLAVLAAVGFAGASTARAVIIPTPILEYTFNDNANNTTTVSTGSDTSAGSTLTFYNKSGTATNLHGAASSGVSGNSADLAFNNTAATRMGNGGSGFNTADGGLARLAGNNSNIDGLSSWTVTGWFKTGGSTAIGNDTYMVINGGDFALKATSAGSPTSGAVGRLRATVGSQDKATSTAVSTATQKWVFFAVSYSGTDGPPATGTLNFYHGDSTTDVTLFDTISAPAGVVSSPGTLMLGNSSTWTRPLDGYMDDVRIFGSKTNASGVLDLNTLKAIRANDLTNTPIPEPAGMAVLGMLGTMLLARRRRRIA